jgi:cytochrome c oxidase assembly protein subunit 15
MSEMQVNAGVRRFAALTAAMTLVLILAGGLVTTTRTGDTIPTWPQSWGEKMEVGWPVEWSHRAAAGIVAVLVTVLAVWLQRREPRRGVRIIGWAAFAAVLVQALIGGLRIKTVAPVPVAIVHACFGQLVFCAMVSTALLVSDAWRRTPANAGTAGARVLGINTTIIAFLQLVAGAVTRHTHAALEVHLVGAGALLVLVSLFVSRLMMTPLRKGGYILLSILGLQLVLGVATWVIKAGGFVRSHESPLLEIVTISAHVAVGAALLATSLGVTLMCHRGSAPAPASLEASPA